MYILNILYDRIICYYSYSIFAIIHILGRKAIEIDRTDTYITWQKARKICDDI